MEEDNVELIDYINVIWKRKMLIIVGTLACLVAGVVMGLRSPVIYRSKAVIEIGKIVESQLPSANISSAFVDIETPQSLSVSVPSDYSNSIDGGIELVLDVVVICENMIKITLEGPDTRAGELLNEIVSNIIGDHLSVTENIVMLYRTFIEKQKKNITEIQEELDRESLALERVREEHVAVLDDINNKKVSALEIINMSLFRTELTAQRNAERRFFAIKSLKENIFLCQLTIDALNNKKTRPVGGVVTSYVDPKNKRYVILTGVVGLIMSLFLAFFIEYLGTIREREEKEKGDSV